MARMFDDYGNTWFRVGDLVTRFGDDVHRVTGTNGGEEYAPDLIDLVCIKAPPDGWCAVGETETNLARRYDFAGDSLDGMITPEAITPSDPR